MADFQTSTHRARWIFTPRDLMEKYQATNQRAIKTLEQYGSTQLEVDVDGSVSYPEPQFDAKKDVASERSSLPKPLKTEEEQLMRVFYEQKIQEVCLAFGFPHKIQATAVIYFKRFYLQWSVMEHHPKDIMLTCIYASCKVEENHVSAEELGKGINVDHQMILNNEMLIFQSLGFDLIVYPPYRSVEGFVDDMAEFLLLKNDELQKLKDLRETAKLEIDKTMLTDAPLLFPPGQLALAALHRSNEALRIIDFDRYMENIISRQRSSHTKSELYGYLNAIDILVRKLKIPKPDDMKHIDHKLKNCRNKKRGKRSKHKSKRHSSEMQGAPTAM